MDELRESKAEQTAFSLLLATRAAQKHAAASNFAVSPLSLHVALSLLAAGSSGETLQQLVSFLQSSTPPRGAAAASSSSSAAADLLNARASLVIDLILQDGSPLGAPQLSFSGGVWVDQSLALKPAFQRLAASAYKSQANAVDFLTKIILQVSAAEAADEVNAWAERATGGLIKQLIPAGSVDDTTRLILANAVHFKGIWSEKFFDPSLTEEGDFHLFDGSPVRVPFMRSWGEQFVRCHDGFKVLKLPYRRGGDRRRHFSMYVFLPDGNDGLWDMMQRLASERFSRELDRYLPVRRVELDGFKMPRFKVASGFDAAEVMVEMGVAKAFSADAELTEMVEMSERLAVSGVFHKCVVEVNEEGTEAAAATAVTAMVMCMRYPQVSFVADHPFMFLIREDESGVILFVGHVHNPSLCDK